MLLPTEGHSTSAIRTYPDLLDEELVTGFVTSLSVTDRARDLWIGESGFAGQVVEPRPERLLLPPSRTRFDSASTPNGAR